MKANGTHLIFAVLSLFLGTSCLENANKDSKNAIIIKESDIVKNKISVKGMTCVGCEVTLEDNIFKIRGVVSVRAFHKENKVVVEFDSTKTDLNQIIKTVNDSGYNPF